MRIVAAEWINYLTVMHHSIKQYEYTVEDLPTLVEELDRLNEDLRSLQSWRRRTMSSEQKMRSTARFIRFSSSASPPDPTIEEPSWQELLAQDYEHLARSVDDYGQRFERMMPVVTSMVQIADSRRSFAETKNVSRLTYLALVFVPLTFTTGLFSMDSEISPGSPKFWIFFAVSIPMTILVFAAARPPPKLLGAMQEYWGALRRPRRKVLDHELRRFGITERPTQASELPTTEGMEVGFSRMDRRRGRGREETFSTL
ncbi:hypothetical protein DBV05_g10113 [Lasiodiplodia theobromae]|uniref:Uncharacterized protein n=1 Tax=Lasiodiplodia theobromae TaxID=45133 RepID=A0A5N5D0N2_9PEZI|nr:hypothetical protein DBV05_g10113 [Lasiodiplodia theobromae]